MPSLLHTYRSNAHDLMLRYLHKPWRHSLVDVKTHQVDGGDDVRMCGGSLTIMTVGSDGGDSVTCLVQEWSIDCVEFGLGLFL